MAITYQQRKLTITRPSLTITGLYTPEDKRWPGRKLAAQFKITSLHPDEATKIEITDVEWIELREQYFKLTKTIICN